MSIAKHVIDPAHRRPVLVIAQGSQRVGGLLAAIGVGPFVGADHIHRMRCICQRVVGGIHASFLDIANLAADRNHRLAKAVELFLGFGFGRFNHQRAGHREGHGRRMETVIDQAFGDIVDAGEFLDHAGIDYAFVRHQSVGAGI